MTGRATTNGAWSFAVHHDRRHYLTSGRSVPDRCRTIEWLRQQTRDPEHERMRVRSGAPDMAAAVRRGAGS